MHEDHDIFLRAMGQDKKVELTFYSRKHRRNLVRPCAPLHYSRGRVDGDDRDCYYFWDFDAPRGKNFLALSPSQVIRIEPTEDVFHLEEIDNAARRQ